MPDLEYWEYQNDRAKWKIAYGAIGMLLAVAYLVAQWIVIPVPAALQLFTSPVAQAAAPQITSGDILSSALIAGLLVLWSASTLDEGLAIRKYYKMHCQTVKTEKEAPASA